MSNNVVYKGEFESKVIIFTKDQDSAIPFDNPSRTLEMGW